MSTTIRVDDGDKDRLRRLQEEWRRVRGEEPSQQFVVGKALDYAERHRDAFIAEASWKLLTDEERRELRRLQGPYAIGGTSDIDDIVYGERP